MLSKDHVKLISLIGVTAVCIGSFFCSETIAMGNPSMRVLSAGGGNIQKFCSEPIKASRECEKKRKVNPAAKESCSLYHETAQQCEKIVRNAYRYINMVGCPKQIKLLTLCEDEWCNNQNAASCNQECAGVRKNLSSCVGEHVINYFTRNGLKETGTPV